MNPEITIEELKIMLGDRDIVIFKLVSENEKLKKRIEELTPKLKEVK